MNVPLRSNSAANLGGHFVEPILICDGVDRVKAQAIEAIFQEPVNSVVGEITANLIAAKIDRRSPWGRNVIAKHLRGIEIQIIAVRTKVAVNDVEENHHTVRVYCVDQCLQFIRIAVTAFGSKRQYSVITPIARSRKFGDWHKFDCRYSQIGQPG